MPATGTRTSSSAMTGSASFWLKRSLAGRCRRGRGCARGTGRGAPVAAAGVVVVARSVVLAATLVAAGCWLLFWLPCRCRSLPALPWPPLFWRSPRLLCWRSWASGCRSPLLCWRSWRSRLAVRHGHCRRCLLAVAALAARPLLGLALGGGVGDGRGRRRLEPLADGPAAVLRPQARSWLRRLRGLDRVDQLALAQLRRAGDAEVARQLLQARAAACRQATGTAGGRGLPRSSAVGRLGGRRGAEARLPSR